MAALLVAIGPWTTQAEETDAAPKAEIVVTPDDFDFGPAQAPSQQEPEEVIENEPGPGPAPEAEEKAAEPEAVEEKPEPGPAPEAEEKAAEPEAVEEKPEPGPAPEAEEKAAEPEALEEKPEPGPAPEAEEKAAEPEAVEEKPEPTPVEAVSGTPAVTETADRQPGTPGSFLDMDFVWLPAGAFDMGSKLAPEDVELIFGGQADLYKDEYPRHRVTITAGFWMGAYEVTNAQFRVFVEATDYRTDAEKEGWGRVWDGEAWENRPGATWKNPGWDPAPNKPVVLVSWEDAQAFVAWLNERGDGRYFLPTEAQWEYACRAGGFGIFCYGDLAALLEEYGCYRSNAVEASAPYPVEVGSRKPSAWGLYDMHGNVGEWCRDWYDERYYEYSPGRDPAGPEAGVYRVVRGGSWYSEDAFCRSAARTRVAPHYRYFVLGFRVCRESGEAATQGE